MKDGICTFLVAFSINVDRPKHQLGGISDDIFVQNSFSFKMVVGYFSQELLAQCIYWIKVRTKALILFLFNPY